MSHNVIDFDGVDGQATSRCGHDRIALGHHRGHEERLRSGDPQPLALSHSEVVDAGVPAQYVPLRVDDIPRPLTEPFPQEASVIVVGDEADLLALDRVVGFQPRLACERAHLDFAQMAERQADASQEVRWHPREHV